MAAIKVINRPYNDLTKRSNGHPNYERYTSEKSTLFTGIGTQKDQVFDMFRMTQEHHHQFKKPFFMSEIIQSYDPKISVPGSEKLFHKIGVEFVEKNYPGYQAAIITHTDKKHYHNHIFINPVHPVTGKRLDKGKFYSLTLREKSNKLMRKHGLPVIEKQGLMPAKLHYSAFRMLKDGRTPNTFDLIKKIDVARSVSKNMDEFNSVLGKFGIKTRITKNTISYTHPDRKKANRDRSLGTNYTLKSIKENLASNSHNYLSKPFVLNDQIKLIDKLKDPKAIDGDYLGFIKFIDETGHQKIKAQADFLRTLPQIKHEKTILKSAAKATRQIENSSDLSELEQELLEELRNKKLDKEFSISKIEINQDKNRDNDLTIDIGDL